MFCRERALGYYRPSAYYWSKVIFDLVPLRIVPPVLFGSIVYGMIGLYPTWTAFAKFILVLVLFTMCSAAFALLSAVLFADASMANLLASLGILFSMLFGGFLLNKQRMPAALKWLPWLSWFNFAFEALVVNELVNVVLRDTTAAIPLDIPGRLILRQFGFDSEAFFADVFQLFVIFACLLGAAYAGLVLLVREKR